MRGVEEDVHRGIGSGWGGEVRVDRAGIVCARPGGVEDAVWMEKAGPSLPPDRVLRRRCRTVDDGMAETRGARGAGRSVRIWVGTP